MVDSLSLATIRALLETERHERGILTGQCAEAIEVLAAFSDRISRENGVPAISTRNMNLSQVVHLATNLFMLVSNTLRNRIATSEQAIEELEKKNRELTAEIERVKVAHDHIPAIAVEERQNPSTEINAFEPSIERVPLEITREDEVLALAGTSRLVRVEALVSLCKEQLQITGMEFSAIFESLVNRGFIETVTTTKKPPYGVVFPTLFRVPRRGLDAVRLVTGKPAISELDRVIDQGKGLVINEIPLMAYAVEEVMPRFGYSFVEYAPEIQIVAQPGKESRKFYPHVCLKSPNGSPVYAMYEGESFRNGANIDEYIDDYLVAANGNLYFISPIAKLARLVNGHIEYLEQSKGPFQSKNITNVFDLCAYEQARKTGQGGLPATIWFVSLPEGFRK